MIEPITMNYLLFFMLVGSISMNIGLAISLRQKHLQIEESYHVREDYDLYYATCLNGDDSPGSRFRAARETLDLIKSLTAKDHQVERKYQKILNDAVSEIRSNQVTRMQQIERPGGVQ